MKKIANVAQLVDEAKKYTQWINDQRIKRLDPAKVTPDQITNTLESIKTLVEALEGIQRELATPRAASAPPKTLTYKGATYQLRAAQPAAGDAIPISDEQPRDKGENSKVQNALKDSRKLYHEYKGKDPSLKETGINPDAGGDYAGALGGDGGAGAGDGGNGGGE